jgi:hypothetical protein
MTEISDAPRDDGDQPEGEILKANSPGVDQIELGMDVVSIDGERIGSVKEVRTGEFLVNRTLARDLWVPFAAIVSATDRGGTFRRGPVQPEELILSISAAHVDTQGWRHA